MGIGNGTYPATDGNAFLPSKLFHQDNNLDKFLESFYDNYSYFGTDNNLLFESAILSTKVEFVNHINKKLIDKFPGNSKAYLSADSVTDQQHISIYPTEFLNTLEPSGLPQHRLELKGN